MPTLARSLYWEEATVDDKALVPSVDSELNMSSVNEFTFIDAESGKRRMTQTRGSSSGRKRWQEERLWLR